MRRIPAFRYSNSNRPDWLSFLALLVHMGINGALVALLILGLFGGLR